MTKMTRRGEKDARKHEDKELSVQTHSEKSARTANPITPIPLRASAHPSAVVKVRPRYSRAYTQLQDDDVTCLPTMPQPTMWQYESPDYEAESSLSALSLVVSDLPTASMPASDAEIDDLDTLPPGRRSRTDEWSYQFQKESRVREHQEKDFLQFKRRSETDIAEADTLPPGESRSARALAVQLAADVVPAYASGGREMQKRSLLADFPVAVSAPVAEPRKKSLLIDDDEEKSWTAGKSGRNSRFAQRIAYSRPPQVKRAIVVQLLDHTRWWLLYPGRIEVILGILGILALMFLTAIIVWIAMLSVGISTGHPGRLSGGAGAVSPSAHVFVQTHTHIIDTPASHTAIKTTAYPGKSQALSVDAFESLSLYNWTWIIIICYGISLAMLLVAALLYRYKRVRARERE